MYTPTSTYQVKNFRKQPPIPHTLHTPPPPGPIYPLTYTQTFKYLLLMFKFKGKYTRMYILCNMYLIQGMLWEDVKKDYSTSAKLWPTPSARLGTKRRNKLIFSPIYYTIFFCLRSAIPNPFSGTHCVYLYHFNLFLKKGRLKMYNTENGFHKKIFLQDFLNMYLLILIKARLLITLNI